VGPIEDFTVASGKDSFFKCIYITDEDGLNGKWYKLEYDLEITRKKFANYDLDKDFKLYIINFYDEAVGIQIPNIGGGPAIGWPDFKVAVGEDGITRAVYLTDENELNGKWYVLKHETIEEDKKQIFKIHKKYAILKNQVIYEDDVENDKKRDRRPARANAVHVNACRSYWSCYCYDCYRYILELMSLLSLLLLLLLLLLVLLLLSLMLLPLLLL
jgi:hypothetical protein